MNTLYRGKTVPRREASKSTQPGPVEIPSPNDPWSKLRAIALRCVHAEPRSFCQWHSHPFDELCLTTDADTLTGKASQPRATVENSLLHYAPGEEHGYWNDALQRPRFWVVHFTLDPELSAALTALRRPDPEARAWRLARPQVETFKWLFMRLSTEHARSDPSCALAESAWLRLLLVNVQRWATGATPTPVVPTRTRPDLVRLWQMIQECAGRPHQFNQRIREFPNYNSLRQEFTTAFGCSPSQMALRTRIQIAKNLLIETPLSIKEIAQELGYTRQHEFTRAFHREAGCPPSEWRDRPR